MVAPRSSPATLLCRRPSKCSPWTGYTKTASTVVATTSGTACLSSDNTTLTVSVTSADPSFLAGTIACGLHPDVPAGWPSEPFTGNDYGYFAGTAEPISCTSELLNLPSAHD